MPLEPTCQSSGRAANLVDVLAETLDQWRNERAEGEAFGDWAHRTLVSA